MEQIKIYVLQNCIGDRLWMRIYQIRSTLFLFGYWGPGFIIRGSLLDFFKKVFKLFCSWAWAFFTILSWRS